MPSEDAQQGGAACARPHRKVFGTAKRCYGLRRMRWLGLARAGLQVRLTAVAYNLRRSLTLLGMVAA